MKPHRPSVRRFRLNPNTWVILRQILIGVAVFTVLGLLVAAVWHGTRLEAMTLRTVTVSGGETIDHDEVRERIERALEGTYVRLVPRRFAWWYPEDDLYAALADIERLREPKIERVSGTELTVTFSEYTPDALWCAALEDADAPCYFLDERGYAFGKAPPLRGGAFTRYYKLGATPERGVAPFLEDDFRRAQAFVARLRTLEWYVRAVEIDAVRDAYYFLSGGGELRAALADDPATIIENVRVIIEADEFSYLAPGEFQYIDLRFGNKVYLNDALPSEQATSSATSSEATVISSEEVVGE